MEDLPQEAIQNTDQTGDETAYSMEQTTYPSDAENINAQNQADDSFDTDDIQKNAGEESQANYATDMENLQQKENIGTDQADDETAQPEDQSEDSSGGDALPNILAAILQKIQEQQTDIQNLRNEIHELSQGQQSYQVEISSLRQQIAEIQSIAPNITNALNEILQGQDLIKKDLLTDLKMYREGFVKGAMKPWHERMIELFDHIWNTYSFYLAISSPFSPAKHQDLLAEYAKLQEIILDALENLGIISIIPEMNDEFDTETMCIRATFPCNDPARDYLVKECILAGFRYSDGAMLRTAQIITWKYENEEE